MTSIHHRSTRLTVGPAPCVVGSSLSTLGIALLLLMGNAEAQDRRTSDQPAARRPTSFELIDRAVVAGRIDEETGHKYRVFAAFGDTRLPDQLRGDDSAFPEPPPAVAQAGARLNTFSAATRAELEPFFRRPDEAGSWITLSTVRGREPRPAPAPPSRPARRTNPPLGMGGDLGPDLAVESETDQITRQPGPQIQWQTFSAAGGHAKVWAQTRYQGDSLKAAELAKALSSRIWDALNNLMGPEPWTDAGFPNNGGDPALDFYLVSLGNSGETRPADPGQPCHPSSYILLNHAMPLVGNPSQPGILSTAAHELMHAIQAAYQVRGGCAPPWIEESSATWAESFVYPTFNEEHGFARSYLFSPDISIDNPSYSPTFNYGAYLLHYLQEKTSGSASFMPAIWDNLTRMGDVEAVNAVLTGGFDKTWPKFLVQNWNRNPIDAPQGYKGWDQLADGAFPWGGPQSMSVGNVPATTTIDFPPAAPPNRPLKGLPHLSGLFKHYRFDKAVRSVMFDNWIARLKLPHASVWMIEKVGGTWKDPVDLTAETERLWCRDKGQENLEELVLIFGNSDWQTKLYLDPPEPPALTLYPTGCTGYAGTVTATQTHSGDGVTVKADLQAQLRFEPDPDFANSNGPTEYWRLVSGSITWSGTASGRCTGSAGGTIPVKLFGGGDGNHMANLRIADDGKGLRYTGSVGPLPDAVAPKLPMRCDNKVTLVEALFLSWFQTDPMGTPIAPGTQTVAGSYQLPNLPAGMDLRWSWSLRVAP